MYLVHACVRVHVCTWMYTCACTVLNIYSVGYGVAVWVKGNTRASKCGTARLQSRFRFLSGGTSIGEAPLSFLFFDILDYRKNNDGVT